MNLSDTDVSVFSTIPACRRLLYLHIPCLHTTNEIRDVLKHDISVPGSPNFSPNYKLSRICLDANLQFNSPWFNFVIIHAKMHDILTINASPTKKHP